MTTKTLLATQLVIERCKDLLLMPQLKPKDEQILRQMVRLLERNQKATQHQIDVIMDIYHKYVPVKEQPKEGKLPDMKVVDIKNPVDFPPKVIGWTNVKDSFDLETISRAAEEFSTKMKLPLPKVCYIMNKVVYFEV